MSTFAPRSTEEVHSVGSTRAPRRSASSSLAFCTRAPLRSARRNTELRRSASTRLASRIRQSDRSTPRRSAPPSIASVKSTSTSFIGRMRHSVNTEPRKLQCLKVLCHKEDRRNVQLRNAEPTCSDSDMSTPLKSHSVKTTRSVLRHRRSSSEKSWPSYSRSTQTFSSPSTCSAAHRGETVQRVFGDRDQERQVARLEEVDGGEAVLQPADVDENDRADGAADQIVPHEPETTLPWRAEQVEHQVLVESDAAEVHRHGRGVLRRGQLEAVDPFRCVGHQRFGAQRHDFRHRPHERRLAGTEPAGDDNLRRGGVPPLRALVGHAASFLSTRVVRHRWWSHRGWCAPADNPASQGHRSAPAPRRAARIRQRRPRRPTGCRHTTSGSDHARRFPASAGVSVAQAPSRPGPPTADRCGNRSGRPSAYTGGPAAVRPYRPVPRPVSRSSPRPPGGWAHRLRGEYPQRSYCPPDAP